MRACHVEPTSGHMGIKHTVCHISECFFRKRVNKDVEHIVRDSISSAQFNDVLSSLLIIIIIDTFFAEFEVQVLFEGRPSL